MATARKLPSGQYRCLAYMGRDAAGKRVYQSFTAPTKPAAEAAAAQAQLNAPAAPGPSVTFGSALDRYIADKSNILSPATIAKYKEIDRNYYSDLRKMKLSAITSPVVQRLINTVAADHAPKTCRHVYGLITAVLRTYRPELTLRVDLPPLIRHEMQIPSNEDIAPLIAACCSHGALRTAVILAASAGLRMAEICAVTWSDYHPEKKSLTINKALVVGPDGKYHTKSPKTPSSVRTLTLPDAAAAYLDSLKRTDERICPVLPTTIKAAFAHLKARTGITYRFHDLRHYYASIMLALGVPDKYAARRMGHSTTYTLQHVYQHLMKDKEQSIDATISAHLSSVLSVPVPAKRTRAKKPKSP